MATVAEMMETQATEALAQLSLFINQEKEMLNIVLRVFAREVSEDGYAAGVTDLKAANSRARAAVYLEQDLATARNYQEGMTDEDVLEAFRKNITQRIWIRSQGESSTREELKVLLQAQRFVS